MPERALFKDTLMPCACCGLYEIFIFTSQSDQVVCPTCRRHTQDAEKRIVLHRNMGLARFKETSEMHQQVVENLKLRLAESEAKVQDLGARVNDLDSVVMEKYDETPLGGVREWLKDVAVTHAEDKMRAAYRSRDRMMSTIWKLDKMHGDNKKRDAKGNELCKCGAPVTRCEHRKTLAPVTHMLDEWEKKQEEYLEKGWEHGLPPEHPKVMARARRYGTYGYGR
jgi:hypothetical protein